MASRPLAVKEVSMDDLTLGIVVSVGTAVFIGAILLLNRRLQSRRMAALQTTATARGWEYTPIREGRTSGYRITGRTQGSAWTLESTFTASSADSESSTSTGHRRTCWQSAGAALADGLILIGPRTAAGPIPDPQALGGLAGRVVQKALELMLGEDVALLPGLQEVPLGSGALRERYMIWAHDERAARRLLTFDVERALTDWPAKLPLAVKIDSHGLQITLQNTQLLDPTALEQLVGLGVLLVAAWQEE